LDTLVDQKSQIEAVLGHRISSVRHHHLHFDIRHTPPIHQAAGFHYDCSVGFNDGVGFRNGTCWPWWLMDLSVHRPTTVLELPLIIQDKCLLKNAAGGDPSLALDVADRLIEQVAGVGGVLTVLWHPSLVRDPVSMSLYEQLLLRLQRAGAWFGTVDQVGSHWRRHDATG
jgi:hypothetical protein